jgi:hypothetical protein
MLHYYEKHATTAELNLFRRILLFQSDFVTMLGCAHAFAPPIALRAMNTRLAAPSQWASTAVQSSLCVKLFVIY